MTAEPNPHATPGIPTPETLAIDRPRRVVPTADAGGCVSVTCTLLGVVWLLAHPFWPVLGPTDGVVAEAAPIALGALVALASHVQTRGEIGKRWQPSTTYRLIHESPAWRQFGRRWWAVLLMLSFMPGMLVLLVMRARDLLAGAPALAPGWTSFGGLLVLFAITMFLSISTERYPRFLHRAGIQDGLAYFHPYGRMVGAWVRPPWVAIALTGQERHPRIEVRLPDDARAMLLAELRAHAVPIHDGGLRPQWAPILFTLATTGLLTWGCWAVAPVGLPWPAVVFVALAIALGVKGLQERVMKSHGTIGNSLAKPSTPPPTSPVPGEGAEELVT
jgi:hypothetical protein